MIEILKPDMDRYRENKDYREGVCAGIDLETSATALEKAENAKAGLERYRELQRRRCHGWQTDNGGIYFWFVAWDCLSLGVHVCLSAPNIEIHIPFGFIRIGLDSGRKHLKELRELATRSPS